MNIDVNDFISINRIITSYNMCSNFLYIIVNHTTLIYKQLKGVLHILIDFNIYNKLISFSFRYENEGTIIVIITIVWQKQFFIFHIFYSSKVLCIVTYVFEIILR